MKKHDCKNRVQLAMKDVSWETYFSYIP
jgi:hypothetical protein